LSFFLSLVKTFEYQNPYGIVGKKQDAFR